MSFPDQSCDPGNTITSGEASSICRRSALTRSALRRRRCRLVESPVATRIFSTYKHTDSWKLASRRQSQMEGLERSKHRPRFKTAIGVSCQPYGLTPANFEYQDIFQEKDVKDHRYFFKRAYFLAKVKKALSSSDLPVTAKYSHLHDNRRKPVIELEYNGSKYRRSLRDMGTEVFDP